MRKKIIGFSPVLVLALTLGLVLTAGAAWALFTGAMTASATGTVLAEAVVPGDNNGHATVFALGATSDKSGSKVSVRYPTLATTVDATSTGATLNVAATTAFSVGSSLVLQTAGGAVVERYVSSIDPGVSLTISSALPTGYGAVGGKVYLVPTSADGYIAVGNATVSHVNSEGVIKGPIGQPLVLSLDGTSACTINFATWGYK